MDTESLNNYIEKAPKGPGVYLFREKERVLYVGKAVEISERLRSYRDPRTPHIRKMVRRAGSIETERTQDERKALLLEANLIKRYQPRYNTRLKDGKTYPVIELTQHEFPQIRLSRDPEADSMVFGPFTSVGDVKTGIKAFRDLYGLRACSDHTVENRDRPCVPYQMGLCSGPCAGLVTESEYAEKVETVRSFFREDTEPVIEEITRRMEEAADDREYERASTLKGYRESLTTLAEGREKTEGETHAVAVGSDGKNVGRVILKKDSITEKKRHPLAVPSGGRPDESGKRAVSAFIQQFYSRTELPERIVTEKVPEDSMVLNWLGSESTEITEPEDGRDRVLVDSARSAAMNTSGNPTDTLEDVLDRSVERIEGFDVSHTGGKEAVGSNVVFVGDRPEKSDYRRKGLEGNDDYRNMKRLLNWRGKRARERRDGRPNPDVVLIDGGKGQVDAAISGMDSAGWEVSAAVLGIAKPEDRIVGPSLRDPDIPEEGKRLLVSVRDEAHRFAKKSHTKRRDSIEPRIQEIDGIGSSLGSRIVSRFSTEELQDADPERLCRIEGVGSALASRIAEEFGKDG